MPESTHLDEIPSESNMDASGTSRSGVFDDYAQVDDVKERMMDS